MMKSFFKKLAFVMALAMVVTLAAPAAQASALNPLTIALQSATAKEEAITEYKLEVGASENFKYYYAPKNYKELNPTWTSSNPEVATVDKDGIVTGVKDGVAVIAIKLDNGQVGTLEVTVGNGDVDMAAFAVEMESDSVAKLTFNDTAIKAADVKAGLEFYYYVSEDYAITVPLVEKLTDKGNGVFLAEMYKGFTFTDGTVYGFKYGEKTAEFKCIIGDVKSAVLVIKDQSEYVVEVNNDGYEFDVKLFNAQGKDITATAVAQGVYTEFEVSEDESGRYYPTGDAGIMFDEPATAKVKVSCYKLNDDGEPVTLVDGLEFPVVAVAPTPYDIAFNEAPVFTIVKTADLGSVDFSKGTNNKLAVGDYNYSLLVKLADNKKGEVGTNGFFFKNGKADAAWDNGSFRFESTNVSRLYVTDEGELMANAKGQVSVLVYYTPEAEGDEQPKEKLVSAISVYVNAPRDVKTVTVDVDKKTLSTQNVNNSNVAKVTVNVLDTLNEKVGVAGKEVKIECTTKDDALKNNATKPVLNAEKAYVNDGKVEFTITASNATVPTAGKSQTYSYKVTVGNKTETFSITVKAPSSTTEFAKYTLIFGTTKIEDSESVDALTLSVGLAGLSNNVAAGKVDIDAKKGKVENAVVGDICYVVNKDGNDITDKATVVATSGTLYIDVTNSKSETIKVTNKATGEAITLLDLTHGAGKYNVTIYEVCANSKGDKYFKQLSGAKDSYTVEYKLPSVSATATKIAKDFQGDADSVSDIEKAVKTCFKFQVGDKTFEKPGDYAGYKIAINENVVSDGNVCFVNSVTFYMETKSGAYVNCGTVTVNDYITLK